MGLPPSSVGATHVILKEDLDACSTLGLPAGALGTTTLAIGIQEKSEGKVEMKKTQNIELCSYIKILHQPRRNYISLIMNLVVYKVLLSHRN